MTKGASAYPSDMNKYLADKLIEAVVEKRKVRVKATDEVSLHSASSLVREENTMLKQKLAELEGNAGSEEPPLPPSGGRRMKGSVVRRGPLRSHVVFYDMRGGFWEGKPGG